MGIFSEAVHFKKALLASLIVHLFIIGVASCSPFCRRRIVYSMPLFVDIIKLPPPAKKVQKPKKKSLVYKKVKKKKTKKRVKKKTKKPKEKVKKKEKIEATSQKQIAAPVPQGKISIDAAQFPFAYYLNIIQSRITKNWIPWEIKGGQKEVIVYFRILKNGEVAYTQIEKSSGNTLLDQSALRAVAVSTPLPPLPQEFEENFLGVHFGFTLELEG